MSHLMNRGAAFARVRRSGGNVGASEITFEDRRSVPASLGRKMEKRAGFGFDARTRTLRDERIMTNGSIPVRNFILR